MGATRQISNVPRQRGSGARVARLKFRISRSVGGTYHGPQRVDRDVLEHSSTIDLEPARFSTESFSMAICPIRSRTAFQNLLNICVQTYYQTTSD